MIGDHAETRWAKILVMFLLIAGAMSGIASCERGAGTSGRIIKTRDVTTQIGGRTAEVRIISSRNRGFRFNHNVIGGGDQKHDVRVSFEDGKTIEFKITSSIPAAILESEGIYYIACAPGDEPRWWFATLDEEGNLTQISRKDLPRGKINLNLVEPYMLAWAQDSFRNSGG
ncbi:MAG: hypothetical protein QGG42_00110 [Phycisphaerae bacterium]|jgi:hypothetical protein|nr:hypothetical protein [Phycisphaerae bacterium]